MDRKEFKRELIRLYASCGSYILQVDCTTKNDCFVTTFKHPIHHGKMIQVTEDYEKILCVLVYNESTNAMNRNTVQCNTIQDFVAAVS